MLSRLYNISPNYIKQFLVFLSKTLRLFLFSLGFNKYSNENKELLNHYQKNRRYGPLKHFCYAPYTSMFFSLHGKMSPCYATYNESSDIYGTKTIHDSWFNGSFSKIRKEHSVCNYAESCKFCVELVQNKAYGSALMQKYEHYAFSKSKYPKIMEFELSNRCNLECIMCNSNLSSSIDRRENHSAIVIDNYNASFIDELKEFIPHLEVAEFTGGDPFLIEIYYQIWDMIIEINPKCTILITTNANCMNDRIRNLLNKTTKISFNISFDAYTKNTYETIRKNGNYEKAIHNIDIFNSYCKKNNTSLNLMVCPMTINRYELPKIVEYANKIKVGVYFHTVVKPEHLSLKHQTFDYLVELISYLKKYSFPNQNQLQKINLTNYNNLINLIETWKDDSIKTSKNSHSIEHPFDLVYNKLFQLNDSLNIEKAKKVIFYFNEREQSKKVYSTFAGFDSDKLFSLITEMNYEELTSFIEREINQNCNDV